MIVFIFIGGVVVGFIYLFRRSKQTAPKPYAIPKDWPQILCDKVLFYKNLNEAEQKDFLQQVAHFLHTTRITGYSEMPVTTTDKLLIAASAVIPIFRFPHWEYHFLNEVILYPSTIQEEDFMGRVSYVSGFVGSGPMEGRMVLAKDALYLGFANHSDKKNVGIHEFMHIIDKQDGVIDGVPQVLLHNTQIGPWLKLIEDKTKEIEKRKNNINPYASTNQAEFFSVIGEYFFERPELLKKKHPDLYHLMEDIFIPKTKTQ